jgi:hypothetical protein
MCGQNWPHKLHVLWSRCMISSNDFQCFCGVPLLQFGFCLPSLVHCFYADVWIEFGFYSISFWMISFKSLKQSLA